MLLSLEVKARSIIDYFFDAHARIRIRSSISTVYLSELQVFTAFFKAESMTVTMTVRQYFVEILDIQYPKRRN